MSTATLAAATPPQSNTFKVLVAASIGNVLEWYDILVYGYFAVTISKLFFPTADPTTALLLAFGTFGVSYLVRPLGALVLGAYADRNGRRAAMLLSIVIMTIGTGLMAIMPTYGTIGILAPIAVLLARLLQGFAVAGELAAPQHSWWNIPRIARAFSQAFNGSVRAWPPSWLLSSASSCSAG
jgi:MHS family proline/betaine transporter-like MFS transporter